MDDELPKDLVFGEKKYPSCSLEREASDPERCGPDGRHWVYDPRDFSPGIY